MATVDDPIRESILAAAESKFREFGYGKTTLAEIAEAAGMSAANLYRFFENKLDIAAAVARRLLAAREAALTDAIAGGANSAEHLRHFVLAALAYDRKLQDSAPQLAKLLERVQDERKDLAQAHRRTKQAMLSDLIAAAVASGEWRAGDPNHTAQAIRAAILLFDTPSLARVYPAQEIDRLAHATVELLCKGLGT